MVYSYRHGFSGFAAKLTNSQAKQIRGILLFLLVKKSTSTNMHLNLIKLAYFNWKRLKYAIGFSEKTSICHQISRKGSFMSFPFEKRLIHVIIC